MPKPKPESNKTKFAPITRHGRKQRPSYCKYCTAKLPHYMLFCNAAHKAAFSG